MPTHWKWARKLNDVWELRRGSQRIFYFWDGTTQRYILLNGYKKQRGKGDRHEIQRAERLRQDYLREK
ncbi:MAG: type II toxin-antitoxin system RelE/ParE family toxin [Dehalococcoidia bacterium]|nr:type II toxin-antitoxin system RelE/ParE family toxin [Dehalococcoidia bacterium]